MLLNAFHPMLGLKLALCSLVATAAAGGLRPVDTQSINLQRLQALSQQGATQFGVPAHAQTPFDASGDTVVPDYDLDPSSALPSFEAYWFEQPLDHFAREDTQTWRQRYWINTRHYKPNSSAPVIVLDGGETSGANRLPFLDTGIVEILAKATGGVGVVLEHRYYGRSIPVDNLSTDALRFLDNAQSAADSARFMSHVKFEGIEEDLTAPHAPWIYYGGSYAGARAAHMKVLYPELVFGAIASSGVTHAALTIWEYMDIIRVAMDPTCSSNLQSAIASIDNILTHPGPTGRILRRALKSLFGLGELEHDEDFASILSQPLGSWQAKNWDPEVGSTVFDEFCAALNKPFWPLPSEHEMLPYDDNKRSIEVTGALTVDYTIVNYANYIKKHVVSRCPKDMTVEECFGTSDDTKYQDTSLDQNWRKWLFQVCTEWGYFFTAPPDPDYPRIVSKLHTLEYQSKICRQAFPPGKHFIVPPLPNITAVNDLGSFDIAADKLAIIDGEVDPWRPATPHSRYAAEREDTIERPFKLIPGGVHHYDEFGLRNIEEEPAEILKIHREMIRFVTAWLNDWEPQRTTA
ncbi:peptidase S28 [Punctularia strigosozonata HHB-11173 SS5]|uniref:peptidase S28 n=1 Tax=Punctularia strigosozonata (strain HHB-11173) TaxID=741275 RepID=UPI0004416C67|nr:peptidase S28 [Punctularia strigosozonata HHB-11173 SS5]EIN12709.1 peptidase S28 [Punctularia strigosozonata HHB-11173 SS5]